MKKTIFLVSVLMAAAMASMSFAGGDMIAFRNSTNVVIKALCVKTNGDRCTASQGCDLTAYYPNLSVIASTKNMLFSTDGFFNYTLGVLNVTGDYPSYVNCTDGTVNKTVDATFRVAIDSDQFNIEINNTVANIKSETGLINTTALGLNTTLLNESNYGLFSLRQLSTEINNTKTLLKGLLDKQADLTSEEVFLITDSLVSINKLVEAMEGGSITPQEAGERLGEIKKAAEPISAKVSQSSASSSNSALYMIIILASAIMTFYSLYHIRSPKSKGVEIRTIKVKHSETMTRGEKPVEKAKKLSDSPLTTFTGKFIPDRKKPTNMKAHIKELKELYRDGVIDSATYESTRRRFLENLTVVKRDETNNPVVKNLDKNIPKTWHAPLFSRKKKYVKITDIDFDEHKELAELYRLLERKNNVREKIIFALKIFTKKGRLKMRAAKLHRALDNNYEALTAGAIDMSDYIETRGKIVERLSGLNAKLKGIENYSSTRKYSR